MKKQIDRRFSIALLGVGAYALSLIIPNMGFGQYDSVRGSNNGTQSPASPWSVLRQGTMYLDLHGRLTAVASFRIVDDARASGGKAIMTSSSNNSRGRVTLSRKRAFSSGTWNFINIAFKNGRPFGGGKIVLNRVHSNGMSGTIQHTHDYQHGRLVPVNFRQTRVVFQNDHGPVQSSAPTVRSAPASGTHVESTPTFFEAFPNSPYPEPTTGGGLNLPPRDSASNNGGFGFPPTDNAFGGLNGPPTDNG